MFGSEERVMFVLKVVLQELGFGQEDGEGKRLKE